MQVAVKRLKHELFFSGTSDVERFVTEGRMLATLKHP